jgi:hypothetical protein
VYCHIKSFRISCLKETFKDEIRTFVTEILDENGVNNRISFGGYGKVTQDLVAFNEFYEKIKFL